MDNHATQPVTETKAVEDVSCLFCWTEINNTDGKVKKGLAIMPAKSDTSDDNLKVMARGAVCALTTPKSVSKNTDFEIVECMTGPRGSFNAFQEWAVNEGKIPKPGAPIQYHGPGHWLVVYKQLKDNGEVTNNVSILPPESRVLNMDFKAIIEKAIPRSLFITAITGPEAKLETFATYLVTRAQSESKKAEGV